MSVARAREFVARVRRAGIVVHEQPGWESRGNGQSSAYEGWVNHHTATAKANANIGVLINGRPDLRGPLCNTCGWADGSIGLIAAHPANHAGASGGWDTWPLPRTGLFNKTVWGHEVIYEGTKPMTDAQYRTMQIVSKIGVDIWGWGDVRRIKFHQGTSITGKWDPGYAPGKTYDLATFRNTIPAGGNAGEENDVDINATTTTWGGQTITWGNLLRDVQGRLADVRTAHYGAGNDPFGNYVFTDQPGTPQERKIRIRDLYAELRAGAAKAVEVERDLEDFKTNLIGILGQFQAKLDEINAKLPPQE